MLKLIASRLLGLVVTLLVSSLLVFGALALVPGDPIVALSGGRTLSPVARQALIDRYHLADPVVVRYVRWLGDVVTGDLGQSFVFKSEVTSLIGARLLTTVMLVAMASVLIVVLGVGSGVLAGTRGGRVDTGVMFATVIAQAIPSFVAAVALVAVFAVRLPWFPPIGSGDGLTDRLHHLVLPAISLALGQTAYVARVSRAAILAEFDREHVETAFARGLPWRTVVRRHVLRNAMIPIITVAGLTIAGLIATTVVVERAFSLNGIGSLLVEAIARKDFAVVQAVALLLVAVFVVVNTSVDLVYRLIDPRLDRKGRP